MPEEFLYDVSEIWILLAIIVLFIASYKAGFRFGRKSQEIDDNSRSQINNVQAAMLGLLALLLAFSSSMAVSRYDIRKNLAVEESNAIGTAYLRAKFLSGRLCDRAEELLKDYAKLRLSFYDKNLGKERAAADYAHAEQIHKQLWTIAAAATAEDNRSVSSGLFAQSINEVIDLHTKRVAATDNHVPESILCLLIIASVFSFGLMGYSAGMAGKQRLLSPTIFIIVVSITFMTILDLDRPRRGLIRVNQQSMIELNRSLEMK